MPDVTRQPHSLREDGPNRAPFHAARGVNGGPLHNLPAELSSFVGREREIAAVEGMLLADGGTRLLTLIGPGGCGKTRLALAVAAGAADSFEDGVWWVGLAPLSDPDLVSLAVARTLSVGEQPGVPLADALAGALREKKMLLVLDNCEHLIESCARFAQTMLTCCPRLRILATSREPLGIPGETRRTVPPLSAPGDDAGSSTSTLGDLERYEAVSLFVERARSRLPGFELTARNARAVAEVCRRLEGIPLAIELAAARVRALSVEQILERLEDPLRLLTAGGRTADPRHRTLRATLRWSYELLSEQERKLFGRLSVFAGGWTLEAAEAVGAGDGIEEGEVLDLLSGLVDKSMVVAEASPGGGDALRYRMLEPVRQYGQERLEEGGEAERVRERHARYYLRLAEEAEPKLGGPDQVVWLERLEIEHDNFSLALGWALDPEAAELGERAELGMRLTAALWQFWESRRPILDRRAATGLLSSLAVSAMDEGDYERAAALAEENLALNRVLGNMQGANVGLIILGTIASIRGDQERAAAAFEEDLSLLQKLGDTESIGHRLLGLAGVAASRGQPARAARLWGASEALRETTGHALDLPFTRSRYDHEGLLAAARSLLGERAFEEALAEGRAMAPEQAIEYALSDEEPPSPAPEEDVSAAPVNLPAGLSIREAQVLKLVARGFTNARVAQELFISPRTVNGHLGSIYAKLGVNSRAAATRFALEHELA